MEREARRRRIVKRESDRMALITGRIQSLENDPSLSRSSSLSNIDQDDEFPGHSRPTSAPVTNHANLQDHQHGGSGSPVTALRHDTDGVSELNASASANQAPQLLKSNIETVDKLSAANFQNEIESPILTLRAPSTSTEAKLPQKPLRIFLSLITPREINSCIITSENTRVFCAITIAILVILSHLSLPHNIATSKSLIAYRPLYVVLVAEVMIVFARLALYTQKSVDKAEEDREPKQKEEEQNLDGAVKLLELGLVLNQTIRAMFIDCSFYVVIVVCGLSLV